MRAARKTYEKPFTYGDYLKLDDKHRHEIYGGVISAALPAPGGGHQDALSILNTLLMNFLKERPEKVFLSPRDVLFREPGQIQNEVQNVYQPDLFVLVDRRKETERCITAAPEFVVEIESSSTAKIDREVKFETYRKHGVQEYWMIKPLKETIRRVLFKEGEVIQDREFQMIERIKSHVVVGFSLVVGELFGLDWEFPPSHESMTENITYADYRNSKKGKGYEVYKGTVLVPQLINDRKHRDVIGELHFLLKQFLRSKPEKVILSPCDVVFSEVGELLEEARTIFQPDLMVLLDPSKETADCLVGPPEFVVEVDGPLLMDIGREAKFNTYRRHGVQEFWRVELRKKAIRQFLFENGKVVQEREYGQGQRIESRVVSGFSLLVGDVFGG